MDSTTVTRIVVLLALLFTIAVPAATQVDASTDGTEPRTALVIGNSNYDHFGNLRNPGNDAADVADKLERLGFDVTVLLDGGERDLFEAVRDFGDKLARTKGLGLFYYAGHGIEVGGTNYLIPTDADIQAEDEVEFASIAVDFVLSKMESADNASNILILDACRDNPLPASTRSTDSRGLTVVQAPAGSLIVYATDPGEVALDGNGRNSPFTEAFLEHVDTPGLDVELMFRNVRSDVVSSTGGRQTPWTNSSLTQSIVLAGGALTGSSADAGGIAVRRSLGSLVVSTEASGELYVDGEFLVNLLADETITLDNVPVGTRTLELRTEAGAFTRDAAIQAGEATEVRFSTAGNETFTLAVDTGLAGIEVLVDGNRVGTTPLAAEVPVGTRTVQLRGDYIRSETARVDGNPGGFVEFAPEVTRLGRVTVDAELPDGARVVLDGDVGSFAGTSDLVPVGSHTLSIRHPLLRENSVSVNVVYGEEVRLSPELALRLGELVLRNLPRHVGVAVDGRVVAEHQEGPVRRTPAVIGERRIEFRSAFGVAYETTAVVQEDSQTTLAVETGVLSVAGIPDQAELEINGVEAGGILRNDGSSAPAVLPGEYRLVVRGEWIVPEQREVRVGAGDRVSVRFDPIPAGRLALDGPAGDRLVAEVERPEAPDFGVREIEPEAGVLLPGGDYVVRARRESDSDWAFEELVSVVPRRSTRVDLSDIEFSQAFQLSRLETTRADLQAAIMPQIDLYDGLTVGGWVSLGTGVLGSGVAVLSYLLANSAYTDYQSASTTADAVSASNRIDRWTTVFGISAGVGAAGLSVGPVLWLLRPDIADGRERLREIDAEIEELESPR